MRRRGRKREEEKEVKVDLEEEDVLIKMEKDGWSAVSRAWRKRNRS